MKLQSPALIQWIPNYIAQTPLHLQLVRIVANKIESNNLRSGDPLPTVNHLSTTAGIAPRVVREAYAELELLGLVRLFEGQENFVIN